MHLKKYFIANWKMNGLKKDLNQVENVEKFLLKNKTLGNLKCVFCIPYTLLGFASCKLILKKVILGAQNISKKQTDIGAFTGCISPYMIKNFDGKFTIIGHSEIRSEGETDKDINLKIALAAKRGLKVILCVGDTLKDFKNKNSLKIVKKQLNLCLKNNKKYLKNILIAYEPIWSIGTGVIAQNIYLEDFLFKLKKYLKLKFKKNIPLLYGGSVSSKNIHDLKKLDLCDGFLIGGASLKSKNFIDIIKNYYN